MKKVITLFTLLLLCLYSLSAQTVDTVEVYSPKMKKTIKNVVVLPEGYDKADSKKYPVLYLLHGAGGKFDEWVIRTKTSLPQDATRWQMIIVCPDGQNSCWYWDSPIDPASQFDTYVSKELVMYIDEKYNTITSPAGRAITGFSMGGHGGLWLGINHPDVFGACGGMSGGVDIRPFPDDFQISEKLGTYKDNPKIWNEHTVITQLYKIKPNSLKIIIDCGINDFFFEVNKRLHEEMVYRNIPHDFIVRPGAHNAEYLHNAVDYQMMFFSKFFYK